VSCAPNVFIFTDEDGDGKADKKEVLFTGIKGVQHDHAVHAFVFGPDGKLYFNFGNAGEEIRDKDGKPIIDIHGNVVASKGKPSPCGIWIYEGNLLPPIFRNQIIHCDAGPKIVRAYPVKNDGAGYSATITNVLTSKSDWFRPSDVCVAPDGSLMIADWNDAGVGGHNMADRELDKMTGRVYRIAPPGTKYSAPKL